MTQMFATEVPLKLPPHVLEDGQAEDKAWQALCKQAKELNPTELKSGDKFTITGPYRRMAKVLQCTSQQAIVDVWCDTCTGGVDANNPLKLKRDRWHERWVYLQVGRLRDLGPDEGAKEVAENHFVVVEEDRPPNLRASSVLVPEMNERLLMQIQQGIKLAGYHSVVGVPYIGDDEPEDNPNERIHRNAIPTPETQRPSQGSDQGDRQAPQQEVTAAVQSQGPDASPVREQPRSYQPKRKPGRPKGSGKHRAYGRGSQSPQANVGQAQSPTQAPRPEVALPAPVVPPMTATPDIAAGGV